MDRKSVPKALHIILILFILIPFTYNLALADSESPNMNISENSKISPFAFVYGNIANLDNMEDPLYAIEHLRDLPYLISAESGELSAESKQVTEAIKSKTKLFGYVNLGPNNPEMPQSSWRLADLNKVKTEIARIAESGWYGVFIDQFGYDFKETRERQNNIVDYAHQKGLKCIVNAWFPDDAMGADVNRSSNPKGVPSHLGSEDYYLIESFLMSNSSYRGTSSYLDKYLKVKHFQDTLGVNTIVLSYKRDDQSWDNAADDIKISSILARSLGYKGWWFVSSLDSTDFRNVNPNNDIGKLIQPLQYKTGNVYLAETDRYMLEYYAGDVPSMILFPKTDNDPVITIRQQLPSDYISTSTLTADEALAMQKRINDYGFTDSDNSILDENGVFRAESKSALNNFLRANGFVYFSTTARNALFGNSALNLNKGTGILYSFDKLPALSGKTLGYIEKSMRGEYRKEFIIVLILFLLIMTLAVARFFRKFWGQGN